MLFRSHVLVDLVGERRIARPEVHGVDACEGQLGHGRPRLLGLRRLGGERDEALGERRLDRHGPRRGVAEIDVNYRYPPGKSAADAEAQLRSLTGGLGQLEIIGHAPSGAVTVDGPLAQLLIELTGAPPEPKQAWTPVAELTIAGVDAVNFGPGDPPLAHQVHEYVRIDGLVHAYETLETLLRRGAPSADGASTDATAGDA